MWLLSAPGREKNHRHVSPQVNQGTRTWRGTTTQIRTREQQRSARQKWEHVASLCCDTLHDESSTDSRSHTSPHIGPVAAGREEEARETRERETNRDNQVIIRLRQQLLVCSVSSCDNANTPGVVSNTLV